MTLAFRILSASMLSVLCHTAWLDQKPTPHNDTAKNKESPVPKTLTFLSDTDPAYGYLETIQKLAYAHNPQAFRWDNGDKQKEQIKSLLTQMDTLFGDGSESGHSYSSLYQNFVSVLNKALPTRYEDPNSLAILDPVVQQVETLGGGAVPLSTRPRFGTLPAESLNARTILVPDSTLTLTVLNSQLFSFCYEYLKIGLKTVEFREEGKNLELDYSDQTFEHGARQDKQLFVRLSKFFEDTVNHRRIKSQELAGPHEAPLLLPMVNAMEFFLVAHEYAHIALGHVSPQQDAVQVTGLNNQSVTAIRRTWGQEAAADGYAFSLLDKYLSSKGVEDEVHHAGVDLRQYLRLAPLFFFIFDSSAEDLQYVFDNKKAPQALTDREKTIVIDYLRSAVSDENKSPKGSELKHSPEQEYDSVVTSVLKSPYPPSWARLALMRRYLEENKGPAADSTDLAFRDLGQAVLAHLQTMQSDLTPAWTSILQKD